MKTKLLSFTITFFYVSLIYSQAPEIAWTKVLDGYEYVNIAVASDGNIYAGGFAYDNDGNRPGFHGYTDFWVVKMDNTGDTLWTKALGGSSVDLLLSGCAAPNDGYIVTGNSASDDGDLLTNYGGFDIWIVNLDNQGDTIWTKVYGGSAYENALTISPTNDDGFIVAGRTSSEDGFVHGQHGNHDCWILRLDQSGDTVWTKTIGGSNSELVNSIIQTDDGGFAFAGYSYSLDGDVHGSYNDSGNSDYYIVRLNEDGDTLWTRTYGGSSSDMAESIAQTKDGGFVVAGHTGSEDGDVFGNQGNYDCWILKLDAYGDTIWTKTLGSSGWDEASHIMETQDGELIMVGEATTNDGDVHGVYGELENEDYWIVKMDENGDTIWTTALGGTNGEFTYSAAETSDGGLVISGWSESWDGDLKGKPLGEAWWIVKLENDACLAPKDLTTSAITPNSATMGWTERNSENEWEIVLDTAGFNKDLITPVNVSTNLFLYENLLPNTYYDWYIKSICSSDENSIIKGPISFKTDCDTLLPVNLPYYQDWEILKGSTQTNERVFCDDYGFWNFVTQYENEGRISFGENAYMTKYGDGAFTLDKAESGILNLNYAILTLDISTYSGSNSLVLSFWYADHSEETNPYKEKVWVRGSMEDSWLPIYDLDPTNNSDDIFRFVELDIDSVLSSVSPPQTAGNTFQVRFGQKGKNPAPEDGISFDDIYVKEGCRVPVNFSTTDITSESATFGWFDKDIVSSWEIMIDTAGFDTTNWAQVQVSSKPYIQSGLSGNTMYEVYVRAVCPDGNSFWSGPHSFVTLLDPNSLPYSQDWEIPAGYTRQSQNIIKTNTSNWDFKTLSEQKGRIRYGSAAHMSQSGEGAFTLDRSGSGGYVRNYTTLTLNLSDYQNSNLLLLSFWYADHSDENNYSDRIWIKGNDESNWITAYNLNPAYQENNVFHYVEIDIDSVLASTSPPQTASSSLQIIFGQYDNFSVPNDGITFDNIVVDDVCRGPRNITASTITSSGATVQWDEFDGAVEWQIRIGMVGFDTASCAPESVSSNPYLISGLNGNSSYEFYLRSVCGNGKYSEWTTPISFKTAREAVSLPLINDWEIGYGERTMDGNFYYDNQIDWDFTTSVQNVGQLEFGIPHQMPYSGRGALSLDKTNNTGYVYNYAILTANLFPYRNSNSLLLSFWYVDYGYYTYYHDKVWVRGSDSDPWIETWILAKENIYENEYQFIEIDLDSVLSSASPPQSAGHTFQVRFGEGGVYQIPHYGVTLDEIAINEGCKVPYNLTTTNITKTGATLNWTEKEGATSWEIIIGERGFDKATATPAETDTKPHIIEGLSSGNEYDWYVRSVCPNEGNSLWTGPHSFSTICNFYPAVLPFAENWEIISGFAQTNDYFHCDNYSKWFFNTSDEDEGRVRFGKDAATQKTGYGAFTLDKSDHTYNDYTTNTATLTIDLSNYTNSSSLWFSFHFTDHHDQNHQYKDNIWIRGSTQDEWIKAYYLEPENKQHDNFYFVELDIDSILFSQVPAQLVSSTFQVRFGQKGYGSTNSDGFTFDDIIINDGCRNPYNMITTDITPTSATIKWDSKGNPNEYEFLLDEVGFDTSLAIPITIENNPYLIEGLQSNTDYEWYLKSMCNENKTSLWVGPNKFNTSCGIRPPVTLPYFQDWETSSGISKSNGGLNCEYYPNWHFETQYPGEGRISSGSNATNIYEGTGALSIDNSKYTYYPIVNKAILTLDLSNYSTSKNLVLSFWFSRYNSNPNEISTLWVRGESDQSWVKLIDINPENTSIHSYFYFEVDIDSALSSVNPSQIPGSSFQLMVKHQGNGARPYRGVTIDNVKISEKCRPPFDLEFSNITSTSVELDWTAKDEVPQWEIIVDTVGFDTSMAFPVVADAKPFVMNELTPGTSYEWYVRSVCGNEYSNWSSPGNFYTDCDILYPLTLPYSENWNFPGATQSFNGTFWCKQGVKWTFESENPNGRIRFGEEAYHSYSNYGAFSLDVSPSGDNSNFATLTMDLSNYQSSTSLFLSFYYRDRNDNSDSIDKVWIRGTEFDDWVEIYNLDPENQHDSFFHRVELDIDSALSSATPQQIVGASFQVRFGQRGFNRLPYDGITFDDILIFERDYQLPAFTLPYIESWENYSGRLKYNGTIHSSDYRWDYFTNIEGKGRVRWGASSYSQFSGEGAISLDKTLDGELTINYATLTLDLTAYIDSNDVLLSFYWADHHDEEHQNDKVLMRGNINNEWIEIANLNPEDVSNNAFQLVSNIDVDKLLSFRQQKFTNSFQLRFGQEDDGRTPGDGLSFDDISIYQFHCKLQATDLPFIEDWENSSGTERFSNSFCSNKHLWEYFTDYEGKGRARRGDKAHQIHDGTGALTLDRTPAGETTINYYTLTLNMAEYLYSDDLELSFWWSHHREEDHPNDKVWIRGHFINDWIEVYDYDMLNTPINAYQEVTGIDIDSVLASVSPPQNVSETFQVRFGQEGDALTTQDGISIDDIVISEGSPPSSMPLPTDVDHNVESGDISIYAKNGYLYILSSGKAALQTKEVKVYDIFGRLMVNKSLPPSTSSKVPVNNCSCYLLVKVISDDGIKTVKVFVD